MKSKSKKIKVYLLKTNKSFINYVNAEDYKKNRRYIEKSIMGPNYQSGVIYIFSKKAPTPYWGSFLNTIKKNTSPEIKFADNYDESAIIFLKIKVDSGSSSYRTFAITFGNSHYLLNKKDVVKDFASKVSRRLIDSKQLTSIDSITFQNSTFHTRKSSSKSLPKDKILHTKELSLIKNFHGRLKLPNLDLILGGDQGINIAGNFDLKEELVEILIKLTEEYFTSDDVNKFDIDELLFTVTSPQTKQTLQQMLEKKLENIISVKGSLDYRNLRGIDFQFPKPIDYENFAGFFITGLHYKDYGTYGRTSIDAIDIFDKLIVLNKKDGKFTDGEKLIKKLKACYVEVKIDNGEDIKQKFKECSLYECLVLEVIYAEKKYLLFNGNWFEVNNDFYLKLKTEVDSIPNMPNINPKITFPTYGNRSDKDEELYNEDLSSINSLVCLDQKNHRFNTTEMKRYFLNNYSSLEICDVLRVTDTDIEFIHVKRKGGAGGTSHLAAQAVASATAFNEIRYELINHINSHFPNTLEWKNQNLHVSLVILNEKYDKTKPTSSILTVLELLTIIQNTRTLKELGYSPYLKIVK